MLLTSKKFPFDVLYKHYNLLKIDIERGYYVGSSGKYAQCAAKFECKS